MIGANSDLRAAHFSAHCTLNSVNRNFLES
jgi:hypothetical protein